MINIEKNYIDYCEFTIDKKGVKKAVKNFINKPNKYGGKVAIQPVVLFLQELLDNAKGRPSDTKYIAYDKNLMSFLYWLETGEDYEQRKTNTKAAKES